MDRPRIVAVETSSRDGSVALGSGPNPIAERGFPTRVDHARELLPTLDALCREAGWPPQSLTHCCISIGPGSFTGLRVAVTFARHLALAGGVQIVAVPTLDVIAENCAATPHPPPGLAVMLNAKREQVFGALYEWRGDSYVRIMGPVMTPPDDLLRRAVRLAHGESPWRPPAVSGEAAERHRAIIEAQGASVTDRALWPPRASCVLRLGWRMAGANQFTAARDLVPLYIRRPEAEEIWQRRAEESSDKQA